MTASDFVHPTSFFLRAGGHPHMSRGFHMDGRDKPGHDGWGEPRPKWKPL